VVNAAVQSEAGPPPQAAICRRAITAAEHVGVRHCTRHASAPGAHERRSCPALLSRCHLDHAGIWKAVIHFGVDRTGIHRRHAWRGDELDDANAGYSDNLEVTLRFQYQIGIEIEWFSTVDQDITIATQFGGGKLSRIFCRGGRETRRVEAMFLDRHGDLRHAARTVRHDAAGELVAESWSQGMPS